MERLKELFWSAIGSLIAAELYTLAPGIAVWIIHRAARKLPEPHCSRYAEEWLAHCHTLDGRTGKLLHALSCYFFAANRLATHFGRPKLWARAIRRLQEWTAWASIDVRVRMPGVPTSSASVALILIVVCYLSLPGWTPKTTKVEVQTPTGFSPPSIGTRSLSENMSPTTSLLPNTAITNFDFRGPLGTTVADVLNVSTPPTTSLLPNTATSLLPNVVPDFNLPSALTRGLGL